MRKIDSSGVILTAARVGALLTLTVAFSAAAMAECFSSFNKIAAAALAAKGQAVSSAKTKSVVSTAPSANLVSDNATIPSIVGFWHVHYIFSVPAMDQEAYQIFNAGGTEVHNPNTPTDGVCLGAWTQSGKTVKLTHRVWLYDPTGIFLGVGHLEVNITLGDKGATQTGTFTMQLFDLQGNPTTPAFPGTLSGERISPE